MAHTQGHTLTQRSFHSASFVELRQSFPSQVQVISSFVDQLMRFILHFRSADGSEIDIETALREVLANSVIHGNRENSSKHVYVECRCYADGEVSITVLDEGQGFDTNAVPDPTTPERRLSEHGRGIYLVKNADGRSLFRRKRDRCAYAEETERWPRCADHGGWLRAGISSIAFASV